ncbi:MAG TPA: Rrf2 family transcriptional regulator [Candidatus Krumholzibacteria bacterium]|nr:Rrf2 family transcriptional regulator [Candidatus Krumholzibacteria bacterium]
MISQTAEYALRAVVCLARSPRERRWTVHDIHSTTDVPEGYLSKVMQQLARAGIVRSQRGRAGGFHLARPVDDLSVLDVINAVDPFQRIRHCPLGLPEHEHELCALHRRVDLEMARVERAFGETSFAELLSEPGPHWPLGLENRDD